MPDLHPPIRIVVADDHEVVRDGLHRLLETQRDFSVVGEAASGIDAVRLVDELAPDILLLDVAMPGGSGLDALRDLASKGSLVRTILLTASIDRPGIITALQLGARGVVMKDSSSELLFKSIRTVMGGQHWIGRDTVADLLEALRQLRQHTWRRPAGSFDLTRRQLEIIGSVVDGLSNKEIARKLSLSEQTVKHHISQIFDRTGVSSRVELAMFAAHHRLMDSSQSA